MGGRPPQGGVGVGKGGEDSAKRKIIQALERGERIKTNRKERTACVVGHRLSWDFCAHGNVHVPTHQCRSHRPHLTNNPLKCGKCD